jgi:hypothetical protein
MRGDLGWIRFKRLRRLKQLRALSPD